MEILNDLTIVTCPTLLDTNNSAENDSLFSPCGDFCISPQGTGQTEKLTAPPVVYKWGG